MPSAMRKTDRLLEAARGYLSLDMPDHALEQIRAVPDDDRDAFEVFELEAEALRGKRDYQAAIESFQQALTFRPNDIGALMGIAWCFKRTGQLPRAIDATRQAYEVRPTEPVLLYNLGCYYALAGDKEQALSWLGRALRMEPELRRLIPEESDFDALRDDPDFQLIAEPRTATDDTQDDAGE